eukprot:gene33775-56445_t
MSIWRLLAPAFAARLPAMPVLRARFTSCGEPPWRSMRMHQRGWVMTSAISRGVMRRGILKP